ncbi:hypothetical protein L0244_17185, partial [bacterium]|nr:hypothetical protein [bacterium]
RYLYYRGAAAHTEFSRMLAEHGLLGLAAIILLIIIAIRNVRSTTHREGKAITVSLLVWSISFMFINAMRLVAPAFLFGLTSLQLENEDQDEQEDEGEEDLAEDFEAEEGEE